jgi:hypothetical protein
MAPALLTRASRVPLLAPEDVMHWRWLTNTLPAERHLYIGVLTVVLFTIAAFVADGHVT